jgi:predicted PhzF superfamily epimerase YddE/YHI9
MTTVHMLRVFTSAAGEYGNPLAVFLDGPAVPKRGRQEIAAELGCSETVFVDEPARAVVSIFSPRCELEFAGHPLIGTAWLLADAGYRPAVLRPAIGEVPTWTDGGATWIRGKPEWSPPWEQLRLPSVAAVEALSPPLEGHDFVQVWAWENEAAGSVRARVFAPRMGIEEDEACGSASLLLAGRLGRDLTIQHGEGSVVRARPGPVGTAEVGGSVALDFVQDYDPASPPEPRSWQSSGRSVPGTTIPEDADT